MFSRAVIALIATLLLAAAASADSGSARRSFPLPEVGALELVVPSDWRDDIDQPPQGLPPTIRFTSASGHSFEALLTPMWAVRPGVQVPDLAGLRVVVQHTLDEVQPQAVGTRIALQDLQGVAAAGYYFVATDKAPKAGEFRYMTQGGLRVGDIALLFTVLTNDDSRLADAAALQMVQSAKHVPAAQAASGTGQP